MHELAKTKPKADDWIYVNNFANPYQPNAIRLPPGMGSQLKADMASFIAEARRALPRAFESEDYAAKRQEALGKIDKERETIFSEVNESAKKQGFSIQMGPASLMIIPVIDDKPLTQEEFEALPKETKEEILRKRETLDADLRSGFRRMRELDAKVMEAVNALNTEIALYAIGHLLAGLTEKYGNIGEVIPYIDSVRKDILENLGTFLGTGAATAAGTGPAPVPAMALKGPCVQEIRD